MNEIVGGRETGGIKHPGSFSPRDKAALISEARGHIRENMTQMVITAVTSGLEVLMVLIMSSRFGVTLK